MTNFISELTPTTGPHMRSAHDTHRFHNPEASETFMTLHSDLKQGDPRFLRSDSPLFYAQVTIVVALLLSAVASAQSNWSVQGRYLAQSGSPVFLSGTNYIPYDGWLLILKNWN